MLPWVSSGHHLAMGWVGADQGVSLGGPATGSLTEGPLGGGLLNMEMDLSSGSDEVGPSIPGSPLPPILPWISSHHTALVWGGLGAGCAQGDLSAGGTMDVPLRAEVLGGEMEDMYDSASTDEVWSPPPGSPLYPISPRLCRATLADLGRAHADADAGERSVPGSGVPSITGGSSQSTQEWAYEIEEEVLGGACADPGDSPGLRGRHLSPVSDGAEGASAWEIREAMRILGGFGNPEYRMVLFPWEAGRWWEDSQGTSMGTPLFRA